MGESVAARSMKPRTQNVRGFSILGYAKLRFAEKGLSLFRYLLFLVFEAYASTVFIVWRRLEGNDYW